MEFIFLSLIIFVLGVVFGSFLCVCVDRLPKGLSVIHGHSMCDHCGKTLGPKQLIPIVSYLALFGKCAFCHAKIPPHIFLIETFGGIIALSLFIYSTYIGLSLFEFFLLTVVMFSLLGIFMADVYYGIIPDEFLVAMGASSLLMFFIYPANLVSNVISGVVAFGLFFALFAATRGRGMGFGDVKFAGVIGLFLGFPNIIVGLYAAFLTGAGISLILIVSGKKKLKGDTIPFGPFLVIGTIIAYFFGQNIFSYFI